MFGLRSLDSSVTCALLGGLIVAVACKEDSIGPDEAAATLADVLCSTYYECNCPTLVEDPTYTSEDQCRSAVEARFQAAIDQGTMAGLQYDGMCVKMSIDLYASLDCKTSSQLGAEYLVEAYEASQCKWFHGETEAGQPCTLLVNSNGDSCTEGLHCEDSVCVPDMPLPDPGQPCDSLGAACSGGALCLDIDGDSTFYCETPPPAGGTCLGELDWCAEGLVCDQANKTCVAAPGVGMPCGPAGINSRCAQGLVCDTASNTCVMAPTGGEACMGLECASGFTCRENVCTQEAPAICGAGVDL